LKFSKPLTITSPVLEIETISNDVNVSLIMSSI